MKEIERKIINKISDIEEILYQNKSLIELLRGYCKSVMDEIEEFENLIQPLKNIFENNQNLIIFSQDLSDIYFKTLLESNKNK